MGPWGRTYRRNRWPARLVLAVWLVAGAVLVSQARLPSPPAAVAAPASPRPASCWVVPLATAEHHERSLTAEQRRLRGDGLAATILRSKHWRAIEPGARMLVVPASSRAAARGIQARLAGLGHDHAAVRRAPRAACRETARSA
jgi:hypothetical protein